MIIKGCWLACVSKKKLFVLWLRLSGRNMSIYSLQRTELQRGASRATALTLRSFVSVCEINFAVNGKRAQRLSSVVLSMHYSLPNQVSETKGVRFWGASSATYRKVTWCILNEKKRTLRHSKWIGSNAVEMENGREASYCVYQIISHTEIWIYDRLLSTNYVISCSGLWVR